MATDFVALYERLLFLRLVAAADGIIRTAPDLAARTGFVRAWELAERFRAGVWQRATRQPLLDAWTRSAEVLLANGIYNRYPDGYPAAHLERFGALVLSWALFAADGTAGQIRTRGGEWLPLAFGDVLLQAPRRQDRWCVQWQVAGGRLEVSVGGRTVAVLDPDGQVLEHGYWPLLELPRCREVVVDTWTFEYTGPLSPGLRRRTLDAISGLDERDLASLAPNTRCLTVAHPAAPWVAGLCRVTARGAQPDRRLLQEDVRGDLANREASCARYVAAAGRRERRPLVLDDALRSLHVRPEALPDAARTLVKQPSGSPGPVDWSMLDVLTRRLLRSPLAACHVDVDAVPPPGREAAAWTAAAVAYVQGTFGDCLGYLDRCLRFDPDARQYRMLQAFAARHQGRRSQFDDAVFGSSGAPGSGAPRREPPDAGGRPGAAPWRGLLRDLVTARGSEQQVAQYVAVLAGLRRALDDWVRPRSWPRFRELMNDLDLHVVADSVFLAQADHNTWPGEPLTTAAEGMRFDPEAVPSNGAIHVFVARRAGWAEAAAAAGWYPLVVDGRTINKPLIDHRRFGHALGYPRCCVDFFVEHNDWPRRNTVVEALQRSVTVRPLANPFWRHTPWGLIFHLPCRFDCPQTCGQAEGVIEEMAGFDRAYADQVVAMSAAPVLACSEVLVYGLVDGGPVGGRRFGFRVAVPLGGKAAQDRFRSVLCRSDAVEVQGDRVKTWRGHRRGPDLRTRCDSGVVEVPVVLPFGRSCDPVSGRTPASPATGRGGGGVRGPGAARPRRGTAGRRP